MRSPWERALGDRIDELDPALRTYFGGIPAGSIGRGVGTFDVVGTPRRWLWPLFSLLARDGVLFPGWERNVPFTVTNRPTVSGTVRATRVFGFASGARVMEDETGITSAGLVDRLGRRGMISASLAAEVVDGGLELRSVATGLRLGPLRIGLGALAPRVILTERTVGDRQSVSLRLVAPVIGTIYEYRGSFSYSLEEDSHA